LVVLSILISSQRDLYRHRVSSITGLRGLVIGIPVVHGAALLHRPPNQAPSANCAHHISAEEINHDLNN